MKKILYLISILGVCLGMASCMPEDIISDADSPRHQIENLKAVVGDEEVTLSWSVPEGWEPTDYLITYNDDAAVKQRVLSNGATSIKIENLVNDFGYTFNVQAVYNKLISNIVYVNAKPVTSRIPVKAVACATDPDKDKTEQYIELTWEKPSDLVLNYTLTYYPEMNDKNVKTETIDKDATSYRINGITNEDNYVISLVANYPKGAAPAAETTVYFKLAYFVSQKTAAVGQVVTFEFNKEAYPTATDIMWEFPGGTVISGETAAWTAAGTGTKSVTLSAMVNGKKIVWPAIELELRQYIIETNALDKGTAKYQGFKGSYPVFSPDGKTLYNLTFNAATILYAYDLITGEELWHYKPAVNAGGYNPATVNPVTGDIYYGTTAANQFYCVKPDGTLRWEYTGAAHLKTAAPAVSADGQVVYILDGKGVVTALNAADGSVKWTATTEGGKAGGALLVFGDKILAATQGTTGIHFLNAADGSKAAESLVTVKAPTDIAGVCVSDDKKTVYVPLKGGLASVNLETMTLNAENDFAGNNVYVPVVSSNGIVCAGSKDGKVYGLKADLSAVVWEVVHGGNPDKLVSNAFNYSHMCADTQGRVFITSGGDKNVEYVIDAATGNVLSSESYGDAANQKQMGGNNFYQGFFYSAFIGAGTTNGYMVGQYIGGERKFWGGPGGDICGSNCVESPLL